MFLIEPLARTQTERLRRVLAQEPPTQELARLDPARETYLHNLTQLTFGGQKAEAYFSYDGGKIIFQSPQPPSQCEQILSINVDSSGVKVLNSGHGRTTCGFLFSNGKKFIHPSLVWLAKR